VNSLADTFKAVCIAEIEALKPGNVHIFADGHGMVVQDFVRSAEASATVIAKPELTVGQRILLSVEATWQAVGCNTNLGIILLSAPIIHVALDVRQLNLRERLHEALQSLSIADATLAYQAILKASPAGLGESVRYDIRTLPEVTLLVAMQEAQQRDRIALQYVTGFVDVFDGAAYYQNMLQRWQRPAWAVTAVYLRFLANFADSHIVRKHGTATAQMVQQEASQYEELLLAQDNPKACQRELLKFDAELKARGLNPGTSADLTVASLLVDSLKTTAINT
jgi:triphosphoribosyl-dephospho-CoA synthase